MEILKATIPVIKIGAIKKTIANSGFTNYFLKIKIKRSERFSSKGSS